ncbi:MAG: integrase [Denitrovibrio sp.]|nr:MAG: integrase [Denitrovibrio sp.]
MDLYVLKLIALFAAGFVSAIINTIAGGGSFLTVPLLIFMGLPPTVANGTNRLGVFMQSLSGINKFRSYGMFPLKLGIQISIPATAGALVGAYMATIISDEMFRKYFAVFMVLMTLVTFLKPKKPVNFSDVKLTPAKWVLVYILFFFVGVYGGFIQAGVGFLFLAAFAVTGADLVTGNALKLFVVMVFTFFALIIFIYSGKVDFFLGFILAAGSSLGAIVGAKISVKKGEKFVRKFVVVAVITFAVLLLVRN